ncbi:unnamed protein product [Mytilus coruscus]|uniref:CCHC-type domain-containing protein n=1 Tax=Mytilus coruscus TaxID=42192 RepID=A0A6J8EVB6_MYTCO|nr:unnamed protein product [Mytilus coruscus]
MTQLILYVTLVSKLMTGISNQMPFFSKERLVSFLKVLYYVLDKEIQDKLEAFGATLISPIRRRMYPGTQIADGTRYVVIRFPDDKQSLPCSMKFSTGVNSHEYIRVIHDNQRKVCLKCYETDHIFATCPDNVCWRCKTSGHLSKSCPEPPCEKCKKFVAHCVCEVVCVDPIHANKDQQHHDDAEAENIEDNGDGDDEDAADDDADDDKNNDVDDESMDVKDDDETVKNTVNVDVEVHNEQGTVSCVDVKSMSDELNLNGDEHTTVDNLIVDNEQNKVSNFWGSKDMDLTNEPASHLENYIVTDSEQIKGSKSLMKNDIVEQEMTDEELAQNMLKMRRRRLGNNPNMSVDDIKRLKREPRHKHSSSQRLNIVNCYAPNIVSDRSQFFELLVNKLTNLENLILIGDMNTSMSKLDRSGKALHIEDKAYTSLMKISEQFNIYDIWRARNSTSRIFSWRRIVESNLQQSRIDFIFVPKLISAYVKNIYYKHTTFNDHSFVVLNVFSPVEKGPGLWIFNNTLLNDEYFVEKVDNLIENETKCPLFKSEMLVWIDHLKYKIKKFSQVYAKDKKKKEQTEYHRLQKEFQSCKWRSI